MDELRPGQLRRWMDNKQTFVVVREVKKDELENLHVNYNLWEIYQDEETYWEYIHDILGQSEVIGERK
jgi:hypothetical protein